MVLQDKLPQAPAATPRSFAGALHPVKDPSQFKCTGPRVPNPLISRVDESVLGSSSLLCMACRLLELANVVAESLE